MGFHSVGWPFLVARGAISINVQDELHYTLRGVVPRTYSPTQGLSKPSNLTVEQAPEIFTTASSSSWWLLIRAHRSLRYSARADSSSSSSTKQGSLAQSLQPSLTPPPPTALPAVASQRLGRC